MSNVLAQPHCRGILTKTGERYTPLLTTGLNLDQRFDLAATRRSAFKRKQVRKQLKALIDKLP